MGTVIRRHIQNGCKIRQIFISKVMFLPSSKFTNRVALFTWQRNRREMNEQKKRIVDGKVIYSSFYFGKICWPRALESV